MKEMKLKKITKTRSHHKCILTKRPDNHNGSWCCDKIKGASKCLSGITAFYQAKGIECWRCNKCDFDLCIKCMQADRFIELMSYRED